MTILAQLAHKTSPAFVKFLSITAQLIPYFFLILRVINEKYNHDARCIFEQENAKEHAFKHTPVDFQSDK